MPVRNEEEAYNNIIDNYDYTTGNLLNYAHYKKHYKLIAIDLSKQTNMLTDLKLSKAQINKIIQSGGFLSKLLGPLLKTGLPIIKNVIKLWAKSVLIPLGITVAASAADAGIHEKIL